MQKLLSPLLAMFEIAEYAIGCLDVYLLPVGAISSLRLPTRHDEKELDFCGIPPMLFGHTLQGYHYKVEFISHISTRMDIEDCP